MQELLSKREIGERIKNLRLVNKLSQAYVANILSISRSNYSQIEIGNQYPSFTTLHLIAKHYGTSYDWILHGDTFVSNVSKTQTPVLVKMLINELEHSVENFKDTIRILELELTKFNEVQS
ncbi:helix-turn-helix domain-containing protein [Pedobacter metabolipauper]|uniref:Transcriptional regulator with XRE-family HTH domain n=1 Tax=Pedobacter metabolipauper TaxID=425513 RepID=A0A4R6SRQ7_9SPHI|nr:helix-turn-helix transcriptional regulator [Pedobacter metabolipauper]TDQ06395.1 transcriptional regulator with XRE-family HTH domain [Pedobacter metabolipauper]